MIGEFLPENINFYVSKSTQNVYLSYLTSGIQTTLLTLEMSADNLTFYSTVANGKILKAGIRVDGFEAMSSSGFIDFIVMNKDNFNSTFYSELINCTNSIMSVSSQKLFIEGLKLISSSFEIHTTQTEALNYTCTVVLKNSEGSQIDSKLVMFNTTGQQNFTVDQGSSSVNLPATPAKKESKSSGCSSCGGMFLIF